QWLVRALLDPSTPLPDWWPPGALGVFVLFCVPVGGGIPLGQIVGRNPGLNPARTAPIDLGTDGVRSCAISPRAATLKSPDPARACAPTAWSIVSAPDRRRGAAGQTGPAWVDPAGVCHRSSGRPSGGRGGRSHDSAWLGACDRGRHALLRAADGDDVVAEQRAR